MARAVLKYDSANPVALLTAARMLAERTHDSDLDRDARLQEASADASNALQYTGEMAQPPNLSPEQFAAAISQLRGGAHEVMATVAYKKLDYVNAIKEYNFAVAEEREHTDSVVWLRLAMAHDRSGEYEAAMAAADKAVAASEPASPVHELAEKERARLKALSPLKPAEKQSGNSLAPGSGGGVENF
jgi:tetratricopeptide (TPR) repeat protein